MQRTITLSSNSTYEDPYFVLGVSREMTLKEIKKAYFHKAKKYHPDLNPDDERAQKMFLQIQSAYRTIESEKDPSIRDRRQAEYMDYERRAESAEANFKSRRGSKARDKDDKDDHDQGRAGGFTANANAYKHEHTTNYDYQEERFLRRYRY